MWVHSLRFSSKKFFVLWPQTLNTVADLGLTLRVGEHIILGNDVAASIMSGKEKLRQFAYNVYTGSKLKISKLHNRPLSINYIKPLNVVTQEISSSQLKDATEGTSPLEILLDSNVELETRSLSKCAFRKSLMSNLCPMPCSCFSF